MKFFFKGINMHDFTTRQNGTICTVLYSAFVQAPEEKNISIQIAFRERMVHRMPSKIPALRLFNSNNFPYTSSRRHHLEILYTT